MATKDLLGLNAENNGRNGDLTTGMLAFEEAEFVREVHFPPAIMGITPLHLDSYQIALLSPEDGEDRIGKNPRGEMGIGRFLVLPLTWKQLIASVRGSFSDSTSLHGSSVVQFGQVRVDLLSMEVRRAECPVDLTTMEFKCLSFFVSHPNQVVSRDKLLNEVWGYENYPCTRTVDNHVLKLRQKLESDPPNPVHFRTVRGVGYKFVP
ncbi:MAG TPA: response regulator transcription factor [Terriglobales bacterium]|jgi:DNA-binding response OmpR family regulator